LCDSMFTAMNRVNTLAVLKLPIKRRMQSSTWRPAWHQRVAPLRSVRGWTRAALYKAIRAVLQTDDGRDVVGNALDDLGMPLPTDLPVSLSGFGTPYADIGRAGSTAVTATRRPVFITARFRSGSTLLWNLFRHVDGCTSYYEPLNERRWFDASSRGTGTDATHRKVNNYWSEYEGLEELGRYYREDWVRRRLYMDARSWDPDLSAYIRTLVERTPGRAVLQFNRVDFRLPWLRHTFPEATIVHLYRHPRDQWCSSLVDLSECPPSCDTRSFGSHDHFYLLTWATDLKYRFPFLDPAAAAHPYRLFYFIWKLSYMFGAAHAHHSVAFETLIANPEFELRRLFRAAGIDAGDLRPLTALVEPIPSRWTRYASDDWFRGHEAACETVLAEFFGSRAVTAIVPAETV
jgi:Sulfotransferase family